MITSFLPLLIFPPYHPKIFRCVCLPWLRILIDCYLILVNAVTRRISSSFITCYLIFVKLGCWNVSLPCFSAHPHLTINPSVCPRTKALFFLLLQRLRLPRPPSLAAAPPHSRSLSYLRCLTFRDVPY